MSKSPSFDGFRHPEMPRREYVELARKRLADKARDESDDDSYYWKDTIEKSEGPLGRSWDRLMEYLASALEDPVIQENIAVSEFLQIMRSVAESTDARDDIDSVMAVFGGVFASKHAWINGINSRPDPTYRRWVEHQWRMTWDQSKGKQAFARWAAVQLKDKFGVKVSVDTIARAWLPRCGAGSTDKK